MHRILKIMRLVLSIVLCGLETGIGSVIQFLLLGTFLNWSYGSSTFFCPPCPQNHGKVHLYLDLY